MEERLVPVLGEMEIPTDQSLSERMEILVLSDPLRLAREHQAEKRYSFVAPALAPLLASPSLALFPC